VRASDFLGFGRCFIALLEDDVFRVRYGSEKGVPKREEVEFPEGIITRALRAKEVFSTDDAGKMPDANLNVIAEYGVKQFLAVPLLGADGGVLALFGLAE